MRTLAVMLALAACQKDLVADLPDAAIDAAIDARTAACPTPAQPLAPGRSKVYLATEGKVALMTSCGDDATTGCTTLIAPGAVTVPVFLSGIAGRDTFIAQIVGLVQAQYAPYSLDIVTTRPTSGDYRMVVLGGTPALVGSSDPINSTTTFSCSAQPRAIDLVFDRGTTPTPVGYAWSIASDLGVTLDLVETRVDNDCECRNDPECITAASPCNFGIDVPVTAATAFTCGRTTQDEPAILKATIGCR